MWFFKRKHNPINDEVLKKIKKEDCDMASLFSNINNRDKVRGLYKELCKVVHPDKYEDDSEKQKLAKLLFDEIQSNKNNYSKLLEIKEEIRKKLSN